MVLKLVIIAAFLVSAVLIFAATKPSTFRVRRSININAPPGNIFAMINDFHNWGRWAPQDNEDATMHRTYSGTASGQGAVSEWDSSGSAGRGRMSMTNSLPPRGISIKVDFMKPFEAHNLNEFTL